MDKSSDFRLFLSNFVIFTPELSTIRLSYVTNFSAKFRRFDVDSKLHLYVCRAIFSPYYTNDSPSPRWYRSQSNRPVSNNLMSSLSYFQYLVSVCSTWNAEGFPHGICNLPYPIYNLSCLEIIPQIEYVFRLCRFLFQNPFSWFNRVFVNPTFLMLLSVAFVCILLVSHETFYHEASDTDVNRNRIVFILVYISAVVEQQYIFVVNSSVSRETSVVHIVFLRFRLFRGLISFICSFQQVFSYLTFSFDRIRSTQPIFAFFLFTT